MSDKILELADDTYIPELGVGEAQAHQSAHFGAPPQVRFAVPGMGRTNLDPAARRR